MTIENVYGSRPELLPKSLVRLVRKDGHTVWSGREGVQLLDLSNHLKYEQESIRRFSRRSDGTINWESTPPSLVLATLEPNHEEISAAIHSFMPTKGSLIIFWSSLALPTTEIEYRVLDSCLRDVTETSPEFWIYSPVANRLLESTFAGEVRVAQIP